MKIDHIDAKILQLVQRDNRLTSEQIGEIVGRSPAACQKRLKRLRTEGIIKADVSLVSPEAVGHRICTITLVSMERNDAEIIDRFKEAIRSTPEIMSGFLVTGEVDFILVVTARTMEEYEQFIRRFRDADPNIKAVRTLVVIDRVKVGFAIPVEPTVGDELPE